MDITETERLMLVKKKEEICELTCKILEFGKCDSKNSVEIRKNMTKILSLISQIASYANSKNYNLDNLTKLEIMISMEFNSENYLISEVYLNLFCSLVNSIRFDFTKKGLKITLPKNLNIGNITNK
jgi:hypothetical protein